MSNGRFNLDLGGVDIEFPVQLRDFIFAHFSEDLARMVCRRISWEGSSARATHDGPGQLTVVLDAPGFLFVHRDSCEA